MAFQLEGYSTKITPEFPKTYQEAVVKGTIESLASKVTPSASETINNFIRTVRKVGKLEKQVEFIESAPETVNIVTPGFGEDIPIIGDVLDIQGRDVIPFGQLIPTGITVEVEKPTVQEVYETAKGETPISSLSLEKGAAALSWEKDISEPGVKEISVIPNPILEDEVKLGEGIPLEYKETYPEVNIPGIPEIPKDIFDVQIPEIKLPDLGDIGNKILIAGALILGAIFLSRR